MLTPLGIQQSAETGKSILFLLEANPGPGLGLLLAYSIFGTGLAKSTAPAAAIIQFFGGIHEIYFPYVLMKPILLLATIAGGMVGIFTLTIFGAGLRAPAAPGSIIAVLSADAGRQFRRGRPVGVARGDDVVRHRARSSCEAGKQDRGERRSGRRDRPDGGDEGQEELGLRRADRHRGDEARRPTRREEAATPRRKPIHKIVFACDAGMGSSAMGASVLRNKVKKAGFTDITVVNVAIANLTDDVDLIVTHQDLTAAGTGQGAQRAARLGGQLHEQPEVRRDRRGTQDHQRRTAAARRPSRRINSGGSASVPPAVSPALTSCCVTDSAP